MRTLSKIRLAIMVVIFGLVVGGLTAFPLLHELNVLSKIVTGGSNDFDPDRYSGFTPWILTVREGLEVTYGSYPVIAYGTDWLAFGHIVIALFYLLTPRDPARYLGVLKVGVAASLLVIPLAMIAGEVLGIPLAWRLIDCAFGVLFFPPLLYAIKLSQQLPAR